jgi:hypothetical protein
MFWVAPRHCRIATASRDIARAIDPKSALFLGSLSKMRVMHSCLVHTTNPAEPCLAGAGIHRIINPSQYTLKLKLNASRRLFKTGVYLRPGVYWNTASKTPGGYLRPAFN